MGLLQCLNRPHPKSLSPGKMDFDSGSLFPGGEGLTMRAVHPRIQQRQIIENVLRAFKSSSLYLFEGKQFFGVLIGENQLVMVSGLYSSYELYKKNS